MKQVETMKTMTPREKASQLFETRLKHLLTEYDRKQSNRKGYNHYALALYFEAADNCIEALRKNPDMLTKLAIERHFNDRLLSFILKGLGYDR